MEIELRQALEPWHVLGEEPGGGGTARYVDSSVERLQIKISGMTGERYIVTCNGRRVPLQPTSRGRSLYRGGALSGLAAAVLSASHHRRPCAPDHRSV